MKKYISVFHFITHDLSERTHIEQTRIACEAGANWIQYRCLTKADNELIAEIHQVASICDDWGATLILTDHYHLLDKVDAQGVHIEDMEADFKSIRKQIGEDKTLGASAHSFEDIQRISESGVVDYVGCGPFSITETKPNNYRLLGLEGYRILIQQMAAHKIDIPVLAVGGVNIDDTKALSDTGVYGVAVSGAVNMAKDPATAIKAFRNILY